MWSVANWRRTWHLAWWMKYFLEILLSAGRWGRVERECDVRRAKDKFELFAIHYRVVDGCGAIFSPFSAHCAHCPIEFCVWFDTYCVYMKWNWINFWAIEKELRITFEKKSRQLVVRYGTKYRFCESQQYVAIDVIFIMTSYYILYPTPHRCLIFITLNLLSIWIVQKKKYQLAGNAHSETSICLFNFPVSNGPWHRHPMCCL